MSYTQYLLKGATLFSSYISFQVLGLGEAGIESTDT